MSATLNIVTEPIQNIVAVTQPVATIEANVAENPQPPTLEAHLVASLDAYAEAGGTLPVFSAMTPGTSYTRSTTCWVRALDWTGVSPWNSTGGRERGGTAISPRHIVFANHFPISNGATIHFVASDNTVVSRTLTAQQRVGTTDIQIGVLNADLPATIKWYKMLPSYAAPTVNIPSIVFDKEQKAIAKNENNGFSGLFSSGPLAAFSEAVVVGDSGQPHFWIIYGEPVVLGTYWTTFGFDPMKPHLAAINSAMTSLGGGYQATVYDISANFPFYGDF